MRKGAFLQRLWAFGLAAAMVGSLALPALASEVEPDPAHEHSYEGVVTQEPSCTQEGSKTLTCGCGDTKTEVLPTLPHDFGEDGLCKVCQTPDPNYQPPEPPEQDNGQNPGEGNQEQSENPGNTSGEDSGNGPAEVPGGDSSDVPGDGSSVPSEEPPADGTQPPAQLTEEELAQVQQVQAMIDALLTTYPGSQREAAQAQLDEVTKAIEGLTEAQRALLDLTHYEAAKNPTMVAEEPTGPKTVTQEEELVEAVKQGGEILLGGDIALTKTLDIPDGKDITLDLNKHTITSSFQRTIKVFNTAKTVIRNGKISNSFGELCMCVNTQANTDLELINLTLEATGNKDNQPLTTSNPDGALTDVKVTVDGCTINGGNTGRGIVMFAPGTTTVKNSYITGGSGGYALLVSAPVALTVENSELDGYGAMLMKPGSAGTVANVVNSTLNGKNSYNGDSNHFGTISLEDSVEIHVNGGKVVAEATGTAYQAIVNQYKVKDNDFAFYSTVTFSDSTVLEVKGETAELLDDHMDVSKATIVIPQAYAGLLGEDHKLVEGNRVAEKINSPERLIAAVNAGGRVSLDGDIALAQSLCIPKGKEVILDLNGHTLSDGQGLAEGYDSLIVVDSGGKLTVTGNGKLSSHQYGIKLTRKETYDPAKTAQLVVESGTIEAAYFAITGNGTRDNTSITINGGDIVGGSGAVYHPQEGKMTVNGGSLTGGEFGVEMRAGSLTVNGGTIRAEAKEFAIQPNGSGSTTTGAAVAAVPHTTGKPVDVTIHGGQMEGAHALHQENLPGCTGDVTLAVDNGTFQGQVVAKDEEKFIQGGNFSQAPAENLAVDHYSFAQNSDGSFGLQEDPYVKDDDGNKDYGQPGQPVSLDKILNDHKDDNRFTVTLMADASVSQEHLLSGSLILEAGGYQITGTGSIQSGKSMALKDLNAKGTRLSLPNGGKLVFDGGKIQVLLSEKTDEKHQALGYSDPVKITYQGKTYTYFLGMNQGNEGKIVIDETGKPILSGQYYQESGVASRPDFNLTYISNDNVFYLGKRTDLKFITDAPASALMEDYVKVDGKKLRSQDYLEVISDDTAAVRLTNRYLRTLKTGSHRVEIFFKDGQSVRGSFSVRKSSVANSDNPKTGDTIGLPMAVMALSLTALAVVLPKKKKFF